jgi:hypothetical protein
MTQKELVALSLLTKSELHWVVKGQSIDGVLALRREIQQAVTLRRKLNGQGPDPVQDAGIGATMQLERWAREAAYLKRLPQIISAEPGLLLKGKKAAKLKFKAEWEAYIASKSY